MNGRIGQNGSARTILGEPVGSIVRLLIALTIALLMAVAWLQTPAKAEMLDPPGTELIDITACAGLLGHYTAIPGNVSSPLAAYNASTKYIAYLSQSEDTWNQGGILQQPARAVLTKFDGAACSEPIELTSNNTNPGNASHNAPSVYVDKHGYVYFTTGIGANNADNLNAPLIRRSIEPNDIRAFTPFERMRLWQGAELHGYTTRDGSVLFGGTDIHSRFDLARPYEEGGPVINYEFHASVQPVTSVHDAEYSHSGRCAANRFTKGVFSEGVGTDTNMYLIWGYASSGDASGQCWNNEQDSQHYTRDSHEVFFAYSEDSGLTWQNLDGTKAVEAAFCEGPVATSVCKNNPDAGILFNDLDYSITATRQREFRKLWADPDGTMYLVFSKSNWCNEGFCNDPEQLELTDPGSLMLLRFRLGDNKADIEEIQINPNFHTFIAGIRKDTASGNLYVWAHELTNERGVNTNVIYEYVSADGGDTWDRVQISPESGVGACNRAHAQTYNPFLKNSVHLLFACRVLNPDIPTNSYSHLFLYRRSFEHSSELPAGWQQQDIGTTAQGDTSYWADGTFLVHGAGTGAAGNTDNLRLVYQEVNGDFEINASVLEVENTGPGAQAGIMARSSSDANAGHVFLGLSPNGNGASFSSRSSEGANATVAASEADVTAPVRLKLTRVGQTFSGFLSTDGINWTLVHEQSVSLGGSVYVGMAVASGDAQVRNTATFADVSISGDVRIPPTDPIVLPSGAQPLPEPWTSGNIGSGHREGAAGYLGDGKHFIVAAGAGIGTNADRLHAAWQQAEGDFSFSARILDSNAGPGSHSGIMIREFATGTSRMAAIGVDGDGNGTFAVRADMNGNAGKSAIPGAAAPEWVKLERIGSTISGYVSEDGRNWTLVSSAAVPMNHRVLVGLSHASGIDNMYSTALFGSISLLEAPWSSQLIGPAPGSGHTNHLDGFVRQSGNGLTLNGVGQGVQGQQDRTHFVYQTFEEDVTLIARMDRASAGNQAAQAGLMIRDSLDANAKMAFLTIRPNGGLSLISRSETGGNTWSEHLNQAVGPYWLKLEKNGNAITAWHANEPNNWVLAGMVEIELEGAYEIGLAATAPNSQQLSTWTFSHPSIVPQSWTSLDIGSVGLPGTVAYHDGVFTVHATGANIWGSADEFHYVFQESNEEHVEIVLRVDSVSQTSNIALAGPMIRASTDEGSANFMIGARVDGFSNAKYRETADGITVGGSQGGISYPVWLKLEKHGNVVRGFRSTDGVNWQQQNVTEAIELGETFLIGFAIQPGTNAAYNVTVISNVSINPIEPADPNDPTDPTDPTTGWTSVDIGSVGMPGGHNVDGDGFTVFGSGADVFGTADEFHFVYKVMEGDGELIAYLNNIDGTGQSGLMMRESLDPGSAHAFHTIRAIGGLRYKARVETDGQTANAAAAGNAPRWLKLVRTGDEFAGYHSVNGEQWSLVATYTIPMGHAIYVGLAVTSQNNSNLNTTTFENVALSVQGEE